MYQDNANNLPRPLVVRFGAFGDMVLLTPLIRQLHLRFGRPVDIVSSGSWTLPLLQGQPGVGEIFIIPSRKTPFYLSRQQWALVRRLRARGAGPTWFCDFTDAGRALLRRSGIPDSYVCENSSMRQIPGEHFVDRWIRFAQLSPAAFADRMAGVVSPQVPSTAKLEISASSRAGLLPWLARQGLAGKPLILLQPGNKRTMRRGARGRASNTKYWPDERWIGLIRALRAQCPDHALVLLGVPAEHRFNAQITDRAAVNNLYNVADDLPIQVLLPLLESASCLISVDTGPAHAAAALGCPTVSLFGTADPRLYRPGGVTTPAMAVTGTLDGQQNILGISVQDVLDAWRELMRRYQAKKSLHPGRADDFAQLAQLP